MTNCPSTYATSCHHGGLLVLWLKGPLMSRSLRIIQISSESNRFLYVHCQRILIVYFMY